MKRVFVLGWLLVCATGVRPLMAAQQVPSDQAILESLERGWNDAFYRKDVAFIERLMAEEFTATYDDGSRGDKAKELAQVEAFDQQVVSAIQDKFTIRVYGNTAVVWFTLNLTGMKNGERAELKLNYTDVWVMRDGRWQCVSSQSTRITAKEP